MRERLLAVANDPGCGLYNEVEGSLHDDGWVRFKMDDVLNGGAQALMCVMMQA